jgi:hypothetical protein
VEYSRVISSRSGSTVSSIKLEGHREVLSDERVVIMASKAVNISHHTRRAMEDLKEVTKKFLGPPIEKFPVLTDGPATAYSLPDKGMIVALTLSTAARAESNRTEASAVYGNFEVAGAFRAEESEGGC